MSETLVAGCWLLLTGAVCWGWNWSNLHSVRRNGNLKTSSYA